MKPIALAAAFAFCAAFAAGSNAGEESVQLAEGAGRELTAARCVICHSVDYIAMVSPAMNRNAWEKSIRKMIDTFGAPVNDAEAQQIVDYLSEHYSATPIPNKAD
jgi:sulfite dehydrogenase (cytochrome) subunit B